MVEFEERSKPQLKYEFEALLMLVVDPEHLEEHIGESGIVEYNIGIDIGRKVSKLIPDGVLDL